MTALDTIREAFAAGIDLNTRDGQLYARLPETPPADLVAAITADKPGIVSALVAWPEVAGTLASIMARCLPLAPADLTAAERCEAEALAIDLAESGGLGQFVISLTWRWDALTERDRLAAAYACQVAAMDRKAGTA